MTTGAAGSKSVLPRPPKPPRIPDARATDLHALRHGDVDPAEDRERVNGDLTALEDRVPHVQVATTEERQRVRPALHPPAALALASAEDADHGVEAVLRIRRLLDWHPARRRYGRRSGGTEGPPRYGEVLGDRLELAEGARLQRLLEPLGMLVLREPARHQRIAQHLDDLVAVGVGGA